MKKARFSFKSRPVLYSIIGIVVVLLAILLFSSRGNGEIKTLVLKRGTFENKVSVSGRVVPAQGADLGFDQSGRVNYINAKVGDLVQRGTVLASIDNADQRAEVIQRSAALDREKAKLSLLEQGTRPEKLSLTEQQFVDSASNLISTMRTSYLETESALLQKVDTIFDNGSSVNPTIDITTPTNNIEKNINLERLLVTESLEKWRDTLAQLDKSVNESTVEKARIDTRTTLDKTRVFLDNLTQITIELAPTNSGLNQTEINVIRDNINAAAREVSAATNKFLTADASWSTARGTLNIDKSGSVSQDIDAQRSQVRAAEADLAVAEARLAKTMIIAPFTGIITKMDIKIGEIISPNSSEVSMMSEGVYQIESFVPEVNIASLKVGNISNVTLDAYGEETVFKATIISIDPAETVRDGVSTYKTTLEFTEKDARIKSGMTANVVITTDLREGVIYVPQGIVTKKNGERFVQVMTADEQVIDVPVTVGSTSSTGQIEIISGLNEGDTVVLTPKK